MVLRTSSWLWPVFADDHRDLRELGGVSLGQGSRHFALALLSARVLLGHRNGGLGNGRQTECDVICYNRALCFPFECNTSPSLQSIRICSLTRMQDHQGGGVDRPSGIYISGHRSLRIRSIGSMYEFNEYQDTDVRCHVRCSYTYPTSTSDAQFVCGQVDAPAPGPFFES